MRAITKLLGEDMTAEVGFNGGPHPTRRHGDHIE